jgi:hypothetical protein
VNVLKKESVEGDGGIQRWNETVRLVVWLDQSGNKRQLLIPVRQHSKAAKVLQEGAVPIAFNPYNPQECYIRELVLIQLRRGLWLSAAFLVLLFSSWLGMVTRGNVP